MIVDKFRKTGKVATTRYVRKSLLSENVYEWCEVGEDSRYDIAQGTCNGEDLPDHVKDLCDNYSGSFYACEWPL